MALDRRLDNGHRARQMEDRIDRKIPFSDALRNYDVGATDVDFIGMDGDIPRVILEVTSYDYPFPSPTALEDFRMKTDCRRERDHNEQTAIVLAQRMQIPSVLAVYMSDVDTNPESIVHYRGITSVDRSWHYATAEAFFKKLRQFVHK